MWLSYLFQGPLKFISLTNRLQPSFMEVGQDLPVFLWHSCLQGVRNPSVPESMPWRHLSLWASQTLHLPTHYPANENWTHPEAVRRENESGWAEPMPLPSSGPSLCETLLASGTWYVLNQCEQPISGPCSAGHCIVLEEWFLKCGSWTSNSSTWKLVRNVKCRNVKSCLGLATLEVGPSNLVKPPSDFDAHSNLHIGFDKRGNPRDKACQYCLLWDWAHSSS